MKLLYNWVNEYVDIQSIKPEDLAEKMSRTGIEVDAVSRLDESLKGLIIGEIKELADHPDADKLKVAQVDVGEEEFLQICCGDPDIFVGQKTIVAQPGARLPHGKIKKNKMRGVYSEGMLCSLEELGFKNSVIPKEQDDKVFIAPSDTPVGSDPLALLDMRQAILDLDLTPNRADALSVRGLVHEMSAIYNLPNTLSDDVFQTGDSDQTEQIKVSRSTELSSDYNIIVIENVTVKPSPLWLQMRLMQSDIRPINNIVDITNYILLEYGQPLHAFDYDQLKEKELTVRLAHEGESLVTLDGMTRELLPSDLVISNQNQAVALAGVMGGLDTEVTNETKNIALEAGLFDGISVRKTSQRLGLRSESSIRFEKGINQATILQAGLKAAEMMVELAGGTIAPKIASTSNLTDELPIITITLEQVNRLIGTALTVEEVHHILNQLAFETAVEGETLTVQIPKRRYDITLPEDLVEEIARIYGYDRIPMKIPAIATKGGGLTEQQQMKRRLRTVLESFGLSETISYALTTPERSTFLKLTDESSVHLKMPMTRERSTLRQSVIATLLESVEYNQKRQQRDIGFYEIGNVFGASDETLKSTSECLHLGVALSGKRHLNAWHTASREVDFFDIKGVIELLADQLVSVDAFELVADHTIEGMHPNQTAIVKYQDQQIGFIGRLHPEMEASYGIQPTFILELDLTPLFNRTSEALVQKTVPRYPSVSRDISLLAPVHLAYGEIKAQIERAGGKHLKSIDLFDVYAGEHMKEGYRSLAVSLKFQNPNATLTDEAINQRIEKVMDALKQFEEIEIR
ncbi:phenylalanine--tRNA ligase subunit beta [Atopobacter phocae]|uniref:phenylalanine--tRNA ligase subunit beta n=1 Tax=Atopobacter phocae TaxID=136492 RepID=UPI0004717AA4|nr:phenylalanine--tRNA ligase subunit beta [Atopobacter phocae]